jgi:hypothetical protein
MQRAARFAFGAVLALSPAALSADFSEPGFMPQESTGTVLQNPAATTTAVSRKFHGAAGAVDLPLTGNRAVEPRSGGTQGRHTIVFQFSENVSTVDAATVTGQNGTPVLIARDRGPGPNDYTVAIGNVADAQTITVSLTGVRNAAGTNLGNFSVPMGVLLGDTNGDTGVNAGDTQQTRSNSGQQVAPQNFRTDVNLDGTINSADALIVRGNAGAALPP